MDLSEELSKQPDFIKNVNESIPYLKGYLKDIKKLLKKPLTDNNFNSAYQLFNRIFDKVPLMKSPIPVTQIVRGRPHYKGDDLCTNRWQISYNWRYQYKIEYGRFNQEAEPLFYGSVPTDSKEMDYVLSCALECCKELSFEYGNPNLQDITVGGWLVKEPFYVINLCFDDLHLNGNPGLKAAVYGYLETIHNYFSKEAAKFIESFFRYFSELSRTSMPNNEPYRLLVPLYCAIKYYWKTTMNEPIFGLIYPSSASEAKGLNIVLERDAVKQYLVLDKVVMYRYVLVKPENKRYVADKCSDIIKVKGHKFRITNYIPPGRY